METGIIGLPQSGRTTLFAGLTGGAQARPGIAANVGMAKVPDNRLDELNKMFQPKKVVPAEIKYIDIVGSFSKGGMGGQLLTQLGTVDSFIHVVRVFEDASVPHAVGSIDPLRDAQAIDLELTFSDLAIIERRLKRIADTLKGAKAQERDAMVKESAVLERIKGELEKEVPLWQQKIAPEEAKLLENYQFLTGRPMLVVLNVGEDQIGKAEALEAELVARYQRPNTKVVALCAKLEKELSQLGSAEAAELRTMWGLSEPGVNRLIRLSYDLLGYVSFFTAGADENRAWTIRKGTTAVKAAGKIHSDIERGFIRAEVVSYADLMECGGMAEARRKGVLRLEGKNYVVQDGDIITVLFNV